MAARMLASSLESAICALDSVDAGFANAAFVYDPARGYGGIKLGLDV